MKNKIRKVIFSLLTVVFVFFSILPKANQVHAQNAWYNPSMSEFIIRVFEGDDGEIYGERYTYAQVVWIIHSVISIIMADNIEQCWTEAAGNTDVPDPTVFAECIDEEIGPAAQNPPSLPYLNEEPVYAGVIKNYLQTNTLSGVGYFYNKVHDTEIVPTAYAQEGFGFAELEPLQNIWVAMRNFSYLFIILLAIVFAFMIMFRTKTSPQTVITVQSAIPKLIITLLLVTFSYAIAGLLVDLSYVVLGIFAAAAAPLTNINSQYEAVNIFVLLVNPFSVATALWMVMIAGIILTVAVGLGGLAVAGFTNFLTLPAAFLGPIIVFALLIIFIAVIAVRIAWTLIKSFVQVVLLIVFGPLILLFSGLPGRGSFTNWIRDLAANLAVFPMVGIMAFFSHYFSWSFIDQGSSLYQFFEALSGGALNPYMIPTYSAGGGIQLPMFSGDSTWAGFIISLGFLFLIPHAADIIKSFIAGQPFSYGSAIGQTMGGVTTPARGAGTFGMARHLEAREALAGGSTWYTSAMRRITGIKG